MGYCQSINWAGSGIGSCITDTVLPCFVTDPKQQQYPASSQALPCSSDSLFAETRHNHVLLAGCCKHAAAPFLVHAGKVGAAAAATVQQQPCSPFKQHTRKRTPALKVGSNPRQHMSSTLALNECSKGLCMAKQ
jgi:hypothetical protein